MDAKVSKAAYKLAHELEHDGYETHSIMIKILCQEIAKLDACFLRLGSRFTEAKQNIKLLKEENESLKDKLHFKEFYEVRSKSSEYSPPNL
jgi:hypothetical protein